VSSAVEKSVSLPDCDHPGTIRITNFNESSASGWEISNEIG
jgi:hypothetical protein